MSSEIVRMNGNSTAVFVEDSRLKTYNLKAEMKRAGSKVLNAVRESWAGLEKAFGIVKNSFNARIQLSSSIPLKESHVNGMKNSILHLKLFGFLNLPLNAINLPGTAKEIVKSVKSKDAEGTVLSAMTFTILTAGMFDSFIDVVNASLLLSGKSVLGGVFAVVAIPVVIGMNGLNVISKGVQLWNLSKFDREVKQLMTAKIKEGSPQEARQAVLAFLNDKLGRLSRKTSRDQGNKTVQLLQGLKLKLEANEDPQKEIVEIGKAMKRIRSSIEETKKIAKWSLVAFSIIVVAYTLFFAAVPMAIPFAMLAIGAAIRLAIWVYQKRLAGKKTDALDEKS